MKIYKSFFICLSLVLTACNAAEVKPNDADMAPGAPSAGAGPQNTAASAQKKVMAATEKASNKS
ncbi:hypothetical protein, partial [Neptuniibacter sp. UBA6509]